MIDFFVARAPKQKSAKDSDNVRVVVRCRPMNEKERDTDCKTAASVSILRNISEPSQI